MAKSSFYKIKTTLPKESSNFWQKVPIFEWLSNKMRSRQVGLFIAVVAVYGIIAGLMGYVLLRPKQETAKASELAGISASLRFEEERQFKMGEQVNLILTMQNTSTTESVNTMYLEISSTREAMSWNKTTSQNEGQRRTFDPIAGKGFNLPNLSSNERAEYKISGTLQNDQLDFLTIAANLKFINKQGMQEVQTNRLSLPLAGQIVDRKQELLPLKMEKDNFQGEEEIAFSLSNLSTMEGENVSQDAEKSGEIKGKIYITNRQTKHLTTKLDCVLVPDQDCNVKMLSPGKGQYSAIFWNDEQTKFSQIVWFAVEGGEDQKFIPDEQAELELPFGSTSSAGIVPVFVRRALNQNQPVLEGEECTLEVWQGEEKLTEVQAVVNNNRECQFNLGSSEFSKGRGDYRLKLAQSGAETTVIYEPLFNSSLELENQDLQPQKDKDVNLTIRKKLTPAGVDLEATPQAENEQNSSQVSSQDTASQAQSVSVSAESSAAASSAANLNGVVLDSGQNGVDLGDPTVGGENSLSAQSQDSSQEQTSQESSQENQNSSQEQSQSSNVSIATGGVVLDSNQNSSQSLSSQESAENEPAAQSSQASVFIRPDEFQVFVYHPLSGEYKEAKNSRVSQTEEDQWSLSIDKEYFQKGGLYQALVKTNSGYQSQIFSLNFEEKEVGLAGSGVLVDYQSLQAGNNLKFKVEKIQQADGQTMEEGECLAQIYTTAALEPQDFEGSIQQGVCEINTEKSDVTKAGPILVAIGVKQNGNLQLIQSRQLELRPGEVSSFGKLSLEYEPARKNYANTVYLGPVTDLFGNLISSNQNYKLTLENERKEVREINDFQIQSGFATATLPASWLDTAQIELKLFDSENQELLTKTIFVLEETSALVLPNFPERLKSENIIEVGIRGLSIAGETCQLSVFAALDNFMTEETEFNQEEKKCEFSWDLQSLRNQPRVLMQLTAGDRVFHKMVELIAGEAANQFVVTPQIRPQTEEQSQLTLLTSPLMDKQGLPAHGNEIKWQYNRKEKETEISHGFASLPLHQSNLEDRDIKTEAGKKILNLDLEIKAGISSLSRTSNIQVRLGERTLTPTPKISQIQAQTILPVGITQMFQFNSPVCRGSLYNQENSSELKSHWQEGVCFIEVNAEKEANYQLVLENQGFVFNTFQFQATSEQRASLKWCEKENDFDRGCRIQVLSPVLDKVQVILYDDGKEYRFESGELENVVQIEQNGLDPQKNYLLEVKYQDLEENRVSFYRQFSGQELMGD